MDLNCEINKLKQEKNAIILAHYYCPDEVQAIADYVGDSYYLSKVAAKTNAKLIVFAGVRFMGESAKALNYDKKVCLVSNEADCAMAHMAFVKNILEMRKKYDDLAVVCYINSTLELKKYSDVCVTSANALKICKRLPQKNIYFIPDQNLGRYVKDNIEDKNVILCDGYCPVHHLLSIDEVKHCQKAFPKAITLAHLEVRKEVLDLADEVGSTSNLIEAVSRHPEVNEFIVLTERGILYELRSLYPDKTFIEVESTMCCKDMKLNTLENLYNVLKTEKNEVLISEEDRTKALFPLEEMLRYAK